jgi:hypothetical protein
MALLQQVWYRGPEGNQAISGGLFRAAALQDFATSPSKSTLSQSACIDCRRPAY